MKIKTYLEIEIDVEFDVDEGQRLIMYPADNAQEGIDPSIDITSVTYNGAEIEVSEEDGDRLRTECWASLRSGEYD